jgi:hypothetical protein
MCNDVFFQRGFLKIVTYVLAVTGGDLRFLLGRLFSQDLKSLLPELKRVEVWPCL